MKGLVVYHNDINKIPLRNLNDKELNLFFSLLFKVKEKDSEKIEIKFKELKKLSNADVHSSRFIKALKNLSTKLLLIPVEQILENKDIAIFNIFNEFLISQERKTITVQIHPRFVYMLNDLLKNFTKFELEQIVKLKSSYSKNVFRILKQFESTKFFLISIEELKKVLSIPETYRISDIDKWVLKPVMAELTNVFYKLKIEKIKNGRRVEKIKITWEEKPIELLENENIEVSRKLLKAIEKAKKNIYISNFLNPLNIEKLIKKIKEEEDLIQGLNFAYKEIQYEIKSFNYLEKTIVTGVENSKKKLKVIDEDKIKDKEKTIEENKENKRLDPIQELKGDLIKWCVTNREYKVMGELDNLNTLTELGIFIQKNNINL